MTTWSAIDCAEEAGTQSESYDDFRGIMNASVQLRCAYESRHLLVADVCGQRRPWPKGAAGQVPVAQTAGIVPVVSPGSPASSDQGLNYSEALVTVNYTTAVVDVVSESIEPFAEFITLDYRWFRWGSGSGTILREEEAPGRLTRGVNFVRNELEVQPPLGMDLINLSGYINNTPITSSLTGFIFPKETLLYAPPIINSTLDSTGLRKFQITKKFTYQPQGWNTYFRSYTGTYQAIYRVGETSPYKSYPLGNLSTLVS